MLPTTIGCSRSCASKGSSRASRGSRSCASARTSAPRSRASTRRRSRFTSRDEARLLDDAGIVRNRAKIDATIANAQALIALREAGEDLATLIWSHAPPARSRRRAPRSFGDVDSQTPESAALAKALKARGFRFVGPTTAYAAMQACGLVNDHLARCPVQAAVEAERSAFSAPWPR